jgi:TRAP-type uncharacterized transport system substrate-binding protein
MPWMRDMVKAPDNRRPVTTSRQRRRRILALAAGIALLASLGIWCWQAWTKDSRLALASGVELKYRAGLTQVLCEEAGGKDLRIDVVPFVQPAEAIERVNRGELDAAVIPAGLAVAAENVRQVTVLECEAVHLFVKPELCGQGVAGLRGRSLNLGPAGSGVRAVAEDILRFLEMAPGKDYRDESRSYQDLVSLSSASLPDGVFSLSPLPSPLGQRLVRENGYQLMELPFGEALALRKPYFEDLCVPSHAYGASPAVPERPIHVPATRAVLIANRSVPKVAIERLLEVFYESDFTRRVGIKGLEPGLLKRSGEYPLHAGATAYLRRGAPWINQRLVAGLQGLAGPVVSAASAIVLAWHWLRRRRGDLGEHLRDCTRLDLEAHRAACEGTFGEAQLATCLMQLAGLKADILKCHEQSLLAGEKEFVDLIARIEALQRTLPTLVRASKPADRIYLAFPPAKGKAA